MRLPVSTTASCLAACSAIAFAPFLQAQIFEERLEPVVATGVRDIGGNGTPDQIQSAVRVFDFPNGTRDYAVVEYDIRSLNANDIELALLGGFIEPLQGGPLPSDYSFTVYSANGITDLADVAGNVAQLSTVTIDQLGYSRTGFDITTILKDRINAGDDYLGIRMEGVGSNFSTALLVTPTATSFDPPATIYIHETGTANDRPDPVAPGGPMTVVNNAGTVEITGTSNNDIVFIQRIGTTLRVSAGGIYTFPLSAVDRIKADLYDGNDFFNDVSKSFVPAEVYAGGGNDIVFAGWGDDIIYGGNGNDQLRGSSGDDRLYGGDGVDTLLGESGDDSLFGGFMADTLTGG
ncbi:MAG: hypothetical protein AAGB34_01095, partial [Planctomycetota bacterium]